MSIARTNRADAPRHARAGRPFTASALTGTNSSWHFRPAYHQHTPDGVRYDRALRADLVAYVVHSYRAPIAWCDVWGTWHALDVHASVTTSRHRNAMHAALVRPMSDDDAMFWALFDDGTITNRADADALRVSASILVRG